MILSMTPRSHSASPSFVGLLIGLTLSVGGVATVWAVVLSLFGAPEFYETGAHPLDVVGGDFNGDGLIDIATANRDGRSVSIFMGNGDGTVRPLNAIPTDGGATSLAVGDMNLGGKLDLTVSTCEEYCQGSNVMIFGGAGDGTFSPYASYAMVGVAYHMLVADLNGDTILDIAASDYPGAQILLLMSNGSPNSYQFEALPAGAKTIVLVSADLNNDGRLDRGTSVFDCSSRA